LRLEIARHFQDRRPRRGAIGDAGDAPLKPPRIGRLVVLEGCSLHPRGVEILYLIAGDDAAGEAADAGKIPGARDIAGLRMGLRRNERESEQQGKPTEHTARKKLWHR